MPDTNILNAPKFILPELNATELPQIPNTPVKLSEGRVFYIQESAGDQHTLVIPEDTAFIETVEKVIAELSSDLPSLENINAIIHKMFPANQTSSDFTTKLRRTTKVLTLGEYFQANEAVPYSAVCIHKALLEQAIASAFGINTEMVVFSFRGRIDHSGLSNKRGEMHAVLRELNNKGQTMISDPQKGLYMEGEQYWKMFDTPFITQDEAKVFTPEPYLN